MNSRERFWKFSLDRYGRDRVAPLCLRLQDECGMDVNLVLLAFWLGSEGQAISGASAATAIDAQISEWRQSVVEHLRNARRAMKTFVSENTGQIADLRAKLQYIEIECEKLEQFRLSDFIEASQGLVHRPAAPNRAGLMEANALLFLEPDARDRSSCETITELVALCL